MRGQLVNCDLCGRDTTTKRRICVHCSGGLLKNPGADTEREEVKHKLYGDEYTRDDDVADTVARTMSDLIDG